MKAEIVKFNKSHQAHFTKLELERRNATDPKSIELHAKAVKHLKHGNYFQFADTKSLPKGLKWTSGQPIGVIGDAKATKGGTATMYTRGKLPTLRQFGPNANNSMRAKLYDEIDLALIDFHPVTNKPIPSLAKSWAISADRKTVFYRLDPKAKYSDGQHVQSLDYLSRIILLSHEYARSPYPQQYFRNQYLGVTLYGLDVVAVHLPDRKLDLIWQTSLSPIATHFYKDFDQDFVTKYNDKSPPTTGAYQYNAKASSNEKTVLSRVQDWWAKDLPQYKYAFNADHIEYKHLPTPLLDNLKSGKIDIADISPSDKSLEQSDFYKKGYIHLTKFRNQDPHVPQGFYINTAHPLLANQQIRLALQHAFNVDKALQLFPNTSRLNQFAEGFGEHTNSNIKARLYSKEKVTFHLTKAGLKKNSEGQWLQKNGKPLSFTISYNTSTPRYQALMEMIQKEALLCGIDIQLEALDPSTLLRKAISKEHEIYVGGWGIYGHIPKYFQFFHSSNAYNSDKTIKRQTNNLNSYSNEELDKLIVRHRHSYDKKQTVLLDHQIQQHLHDSAIFIPLFKYNYTLTCSSRWIQWPDSPSMKFAPARVYSPTDSYYWWIDEKLKRETLDAIQQNKSFPSSLDQITPVL